MATKKPRRTSAFITAMQGVTPSQGETVEQEEGVNAIRQEGETVTPDQRITVSPDNGNTGTLTEGVTVVAPQSSTEIPLQGETVLLLHHKKNQKITFYFSKEEEKRIEQLEMGYWIETGIKINRNDIARYLFNKVTLEELIEHMPRKPADLP